MASGDVYKKVSGSWVLQGNIAGPPGPTGNTGSTGAAGAGIGAILYDFTITGSDQAAIDTDVDGTAALLSTSYTSMEIHFIGRTDEAVLQSNVDVILNNDTGSNYHRALIASSSSGTTPAVVNDVASAKFIGPTVTGSSAGASIPGILKMTIPGYAATVFQKIIDFTSHSVDSTSGNTHRTVEVGCFVWASTAAINRVKITPDTAGKKLKVGSRLIIFGF